MARELCLLADVTALVPGYVSDAATDALLNTLITGESRSAHQLCDREFVAIAGAGVRRYDLDAGTLARRSVWIDDATTITAVAIENQSQQTVETITSPNYVEMPRVREEWQPISQLAFPAFSSQPASMLGAGYVLKVTATFGWPAVPADLKMAVAKMVLIRYLADVAVAGTRFAEALQEQQFEVGQAFAAAQSVFRRYARFPLTGG